MTNRLLRLSPVTEGGDLLQLQNICPFTPNICSLPPFETTLVNLHFE